MKSSCAAGAGCSRIVATNTHRSRGRSRMAACRPRAGGSVLPQVAREVRPGLSNPVRPLSGHQQGDSALDSGVTDAAVARARRRGWSCESRRNSPVHCWPTGLHWPSELHDDLTVWHPATAGEAHLLRQEWSERSQPVPRGPSRQSIDAARSRVDDAPNRSSLDVFQEPGRYDPSAVRWYNRSLRKIIRPMKTGGD